MSNSKMFLPEPFQLNFYQHITKKLNGKSLIILAGFDRYLLDTKRSIMLSEFECISCCGTLEPMVKIYKTHSVICIIILSYILENEKKASN